MKRNIIVLGVVVFVALAGGLGAWYYLAGPGKTSRIERAVTALKQDKKAQVAAAEALKTAAELPAGWQNLTFDETKEVSIIVDDLAANRQYKVDNYREPSAATIAQDIVAADKALKKVEKNLEAANKELQKADQNFLPAKTAAEIDTALESNKAAARKIKAARAALKELKSDNFIWGHIAVVVGINGDIMTALDRADAALKAGDYVALQEATNESMGAVAQSIDWLQGGELELTNVGIYAKDADELRNFISQAKDTTRCFEQAAAFMFGNRANAAALQQSSEQAADRLAALQKIADRQQFGRGYKVWFLAAANRRL